MLPKTPELYFFRISTNKDALPEKAKRNLHYCMGKKTEYFLIVNLFLIPNNRTLSQY